MLQRSDFPLLGQTMNGEPLAYFDNGASSAKLAKALMAEKEFYETQGVNVHRGVYALSSQATAQYDAAREVVQKFLGAKSAKEIVFTKNATEALNLLAHSVGAMLQSGDAILLTEMDHHASIVPWFEVAKRKGLKLLVSPINDEGELILEEYRELFENHTIRFVNIPHISNSLGTINPVKELIEIAHAHGAQVCIDGSQAAPHMPVDVVDLDADFYAFTGHKVFAPMGIGVLYGKEDVLNSLPPYQGGGDMILSVDFNGVEYQKAPTRFEAGTPNVGGAIALAKALEYIMAHRNEIVAQETILIEAMDTLFSSMDGVRLLGPKHRAPIYSFVVKGVHAHDIGTFLDSKGIAIRAGHHCTQPVMKRFGVPATARASLAAYNTVEEVQRLGDALQELKTFFQV